MAPPSPYFTDIQFKNLQKSCVVGLAPAGLDPSAPRGVAEDATLASSKLLKRCVVEGAVKVSRGMQKLVLESWNCWTVCTTLFPCCVAFGCGMQR